MAKLEIIVKVTEKKGIQVGRTVYLFNKPKVVVGFWNNSLVFATDNPKTMPDAQVLIYTTSELKEIFEEGSLQGLVDIE
jgi:hypothetical protein